MTIFAIKTESKMPKCVIALVVNSLQENEYNFMPLHSMWKISKELICLSIEWKLKYVKNAPPPPPTFHKSAQFVGNFRLCRNFKTIEYSEIDRKNYWGVSQHISIERRFDYLETICLICCVNHISHFSAYSYLLKEPKTMKN